MKVPSSLRKAAPRKAHKERSQLSARAHLGLLEKKKDYTLRAADFKSKQTRLGALKRKAAFRNADEFYFGMINSRTNKGVHIKESRAKAFTADELALLRTQDQNYINYQRSVNLKKMDRLQGLKHIPADGELQEINGDDAEEENEDEDETPATTRKSAGKPTHTIFVDSEKDAMTFDPIKHFQTPAELLKKRHNRPRVASMEEADVAGETKDAREAELDQHALNLAASLRKLAKKKVKAQRELASREKREEQLRKLQMEVEMQKNLMGKGAKRKVGESKQGLAIYKWRAERKR